MLLSSLRSGTNSLEIERGRWRHLDEKDRLCKYCSLNKVESELHFLSECTLYQVERQSLFQNICNVSNNKWNLNSKSPNDQLILLLAGSGDEFEMEIFKLVQSFIVKCFNLRNQNVL